jgi:hypothetical protein
VDQLGSCGNAAATRQGYLFCRAMPPGQLEGWLARPHSGTITRDTSGDD